MCMSMTEALQKAMKTSIEKGQVAGVSLLVEK